MNHLEQLVAEWLQYRGYFVRTAVLVGPRPKGGFEGELDVVGLHVANQHLMHVECSLDALSWADRERRFAKKVDHVSSMRGNFSRAVLSLKQRGRAAELGGSSRRSGNRP